MLFVKNVTSGPGQLEPFEVTVAVPPLGAPAIQELLRGLLGRFPFDPLFIERLSHETGGVPSSIVSAVLELIDKHLLWRRSGEWRIAELSESDWDHLKSARSRRSRDWDRLTEREKDVLTAVALVEGGLDEASLAKVFPAVDNGTTIVKLASYALVNISSRQVTLASRDVERIALSRENEERSMRLRVRLLASVGNELQRAARARLVIEGPATPEALEEGVWLGSYYLREGSYVRATRAFLRTRDLARAMGNIECARIASLHAADVLHRAGSLREATVVLSDSREWADSPEDLVVTRSREMLLGVLAKGLGDTRAAESHFAECSEMAKGSEPRTWLQAEAELAELEWRHGGQPGREAAAKRIEGLLSLRHQLSGYRDEWAALKYQHGASLVVEGKRDAAIPVLAEALELAQSEYWLMRINNALAAAHFYLGNMRDGLEAADAAWQFAVKGGFDSFKPRVLMSRGTLKAGLGQYRESAEQNVMAASWGRRVGNPFDVEAALISAVADLYTLADYEQAIAFARETREVALKIPNGRDVSKSLELEGLINLHLGDYSAASSLFAEARTSLEGRGFDDLVPRLLWHEGRLQVEQGQMQEAEEKFVEALGILETTRDFEDLPGVQVEMQILFSRARDHRLNIEELRGLLDNAKRRELGTVRLRASVALGEVAVTNLKDPGQVLAALMEELRFAEGAGANEFVWRLNYWVSRILREVEDPRGANSRLASAVRIAREVASKLTPKHRSSYLATPHARLLLSESSGSQTR
jgi:tetratricopeptide (TPR) repeat protein